VDPDAITLALRRQRIDVLRNRHVTLWFGGESMYLAGVDDYGYAEFRAMLLRSCWRTIPA
jgi:hypothetical protein